MLCKLAVSKGMIQHFILLVDHLGRGLLQKSKSIKISLCHQSAPHKALFERQSNLEVTNYLATLEFVWSFLASTTLNFTWARTLAGLNLEGWSEFN